MPEILFTKDAELQRGGERFAAGTVYNLRPDSVARWLRRGVATTDPAAIAAAKTGKAPVATGGAAAKPAPDFVPAAWRDLPATKLRELAARLTGAKAANKAAAIAAIEAEIARREAAAVPAAPEAAPDASADLPPADGETLL